MTARGSTGFAKPNGCGCRWSHSIPAPGTRDAIADLGPSPPVNNPVKGLSVGEGGRTMVTSLVRLRGGLWTLGNVRWRDNSPGWLRFFRPR